MIEKLLKGLGSAHVALLNRQHADTVEGRAILEDAARDVADVLAYVRDAEAQI
jgi:hypothetical protein